MNFSRACGVLLHPTSLANRYPIGGFGRSAFDFVDFLKLSGQAYWQILPLGPTGMGNSPYSTFSAFAGNPLLISPDDLVNLGLLESEDLEISTMPSARADYGNAFDWKTKVLSRAFELFRAGRAPALTAEFESFSQQQSWWLDDYATFRALKSAHNGNPWYKWADPLKLRNPDALMQSRSQMARAIDSERFQQFIFFRQWRALKQYANENGIRIIGDIPIFLALDSSDVWCNREQFKLDAKGDPTVVAGVPPDYFSKTGQLWGNPIYDWEAMRSEGFNWWTARVAFALQINDIVRLDHFIGFIRNWEVPFGDKTAEDGQWNSVPGNALFEAMISRLGELPLIAEDLGAMTPEVEALRDKLGIPGMRILQYAFGGDAFNRDLPHNYVRNSVAYTGTHDNDTTLGWHKAAGKEQKAHLKRYLNAGSRNAPWDLARLAHASVADTVIVPMQDYLELGTAARMNTPATENGNWDWRLLEGQLTDGLAERMRSLADTYARTPRL